MFLFLFRALTTLAPLLLLGSGLTLCLRKGKARYLHGSLFLLILSGILAFPLSNFIISSMVYNAEALVVELAVFAKSEAQALRIMGTPEKVLLHGSSDKQLGYPFQYWWCYADDGVYLNLFDGKVDSVYRYEW